MEQLDLFNFEGVKFENDSSYSRKVMAPMYEPRPGKGNLYTCYDSQKYNMLLRRIEESNVSEQEKTFLKLAATRFIEFNYQNIADYYAIASKDMQELMEKLALVIIDFGKAIEEGFIQLDDKIRKLYELEAR